MAESTISHVSDAYDRACDGCPFRDECRDYQDAFGPQECFRDDWMRSLMGYLRCPDQEVKECPRQSD